MATADIKQSSLKVKGEASCVGGKHPDPPLDKFGLLCWMVNHPAHGSKVFTEDGKATVEEIALAACETSNLDVLAGRFGTTSSHVDQAISYAIQAGYLGS